MELIIKPTEACNFKCTFCSSSNIAATNNKILNLDTIKDFLIRFPETNTIIVNGGDPLMVRPEYYWNIIDFLDQHEMKTTLSFTSNLWPFYKNPERWAQLFNHPRMGVTTSFQYGDGRRITADRVFTEADFWNVSDAFLDHVGYRPDFISVISEENESSAIDNVRLAKKMGVECKLNYAMASGEQGSPYQLSKMYKLYVDVYNAGLTEWEFNTKQMVRRLSQGNTVCPQSLDCDSHIRCIQPDGDYYSCGSFADDKDKPINFELEVKQGQFFTPLSDDVELVSMHSGCFTCPMFKICNGCKKTIKDHKEHNMVDDHCTLMKTLLPTILEITDSESVNKPII